MSGSPTTDLHEFASDCVDSMGDVFWDFESHRDGPGDYSDPHETAVLAVERTLREVLANAVRIEGGITLFRAEYETMLSKLPDGATNDQLIQALVQECDWSEKGAIEVLQLARKYGTSVLRNAIALASAMGIEDGEAGF